MTDQDRIAALETGMDRMQDLLTVQYTQIAKLTGDVLAFQTALREAISFLAQTGQGPAMIQQIETVGSRSLNAMQDSIPPNSNVQGLSLELGMEAFQTLMMDLKSRL